MSEDSPVLLASYSDEFQSNLWEGIPESKILEKAHEGVCRAFNVDANSVPKPIKYIKKYGHTQHIRYIYIRQE